MQFKEVHTKLWHDRIMEFVDTVHPTWECNVGASPQMMHVSEDGLKAFLERERSTVVVAIDGTKVIGYVIGDDDKSGRGGCRGRWVGVFPQKGYPADVVLKGLLDVLCDKYGWVWGNIHNPLIQNTMFSFGCVTEPNEPTIFVYRRD